MVYPREISAVDNRACPSLLALKSVTQSYRSTPEIQTLLEIFRHMVNDCIEIGLSCNAAALKRLAMLSWPRRREYQCPSYYKACAVSRAAGILAARRKSLRRGIQTRNPYSLRPQLTAYQGFRIENGALRIPVGRRRFQYVPVVRHSISILSDPAIKVRSFTLTPTSLSLCIAREVPDLECTGTIGLDRNLGNLTMGNEDRIMQYELSETVRVAETTTRIVGSFKRDDHRIRIEIRIEIASKYGKRRRHRIQYVLHHATKRIVSEAVERRRVIVLENIEGIRRLYRRGNGQGRKYRRRMNGWSFSEAQRAR